MLIQDKFISTSELQQNVSKTIDKSKHQDIIIIRNNKLEAAIISIDRYNQYLEYLEWKKISDTLNSSGRKNSINTIESYVSALIDSYIIYKVNRYDIKGKQHLKTLEKYYVCDLGLRNYLLGNKEGMDLGHILENIIFLELKRRGHKIYVGKTENSEIDFVIEDNREIKYIQVALTVRDKNTLNRELAPLNSIEDHHPKYLITLDFDTNNHSGIKQINALDYLMGRVDI